MADLSILMRGLVLGFSIAAPVGPIGVLCIRRTLAEGRASGFATGMGAAAADGLYGVIAAFGLTWITAMLVAQQNWIRVIGGLFLLYLGVRTFFARPAEQAAAAGGTGLVGAFGSTFVLTLTNPMTILSFLAVFAGLGLGAGVTGPMAAVLLVTGVVVGSAAWWLILSGAVGALRARIDGHALQWVNRVSGAVISAFGVVALATAAGFGGPEV
ncbi:MAG TPA: LysE family transporter [Candidatus Eisenbacteria bacterium]|nr:LysE family transporter [Candidatus Eisenbacteria bacterium]